MPFRLARVQMAEVKRSLPSPVYVQQAGPAFEEAGERIPVVIQPLTGAVKAASYGLDITRMRLMMTVSRKELAMGMAVCLEGEGAYVICEPVEQWGNHQKAVLKRLRE